MEYSVRGTCDTCCMCDIQNLATGPTQLTTRVSCVTLRSCAIADDGDHSRQLYPAAFANVTLPDCP